MPDLLAGAWATPGLAALILTALLAGVVYGFAGFGAALIFMPVAARIVDPVTAVAAFAVTSLGSILTVLPQAWADCDRRASVITLGAALALLPLGVWVLRTSDPTALRWGVSAVVIGTLAALVAGWRYTFSPGPRSWAAVGAGVGFLGGATGINGPVLILFQLGGQLSVARMRANTIVPLTLSSFALLPVMALQGAVTKATLALGLMLFVPYAVGGYAGRRLFDPKRAGIYRRIAYVIIAAAALVGLPVME